MTDRHSKVIVRSKGRTVLPFGEEGDEFRVQVSADGSQVVLTKLATVKTRPTKVRVEKRGGFSVGVLDQPINELALKEALAEFP